MEKWARAKYQPCLPLGENNTAVTGCKRHIELSRRAAQEGTVLLKNENGNLPLKSGTKIAIFGKAQFDYVKGGGGSGDVNTVYTRNIYDGLKLKNVELFEELSGYYGVYVNECYKAGENAGELSEPELPEELVKKAAAFTDTAIITISRFSYEGGDRKNDGTDAYYYLSDTERKMVEAVCASFKHITVLLNTGAVIDVTWFADNPDIESAVMIWQGGTEGGLAAADILTGDANPSGKLADVCAVSFDSYMSSENFDESDDYVQYTDDVFVGYRYFMTIPDAAKDIVYPFGYGLSYTSFDISNVKICENGEEIFVSAQVTNNGKYSGKEVLQVYSCPNCGIITKPRRELRAFAKTPLLKSKESCIVTMSFKTSDMAVYDDLGQIKKSAYVLEKGKYQFAVGNSSMADINEYTLDIAENIIVKQLSELCPSRNLTKRLMANGEYYPAINTNRERLSFDCDYNAPPYKKSVQNQIKLIDVAEGRETIDAFISQLSDDELADLLMGQPNLGVANTSGIGGAKLSKGEDEHGIPRIMTADGPAGLRIFKECGVRTTAFPVASMIAASWNTELAEEIGKAGALEAKENNIGIWLTPALNIHRSPLCGRNFEYYSEDPLISGKMAAAIVRGIQSQGVCAVPKHFACNNKETNRYESDSIVSERALREIYLRGFEICVKEAKPRAVMSSYNKLNGIFTPENAELIMGILRGEWKYDGIVMSDWDNHGNHIKEIKAGNDVKMPTADKKLVTEALKEKKLTRNEAAACARRVLKMIIDTE